ncbi:YwdI family protein [Planococcus beigongshangi]|uniref:YwdI family protein n=1 Tax=Planococcus beigongshangi TaxID=2782536 RepID=UPI00193B0155|nr:YwdI family protein [Planococcus beigongshangi]
MTVGHERVIAEIEKHARQARMGDSAKMRESLAAIRALCDLVLEGEQQPGARAPRAIPLSASPAPQPVLSEKKLEEDGANGDSLFEF